MFKKFIFALPIIIFIISFPSVLQAQQSNVDEPETKEPQNAIYLELFGNGLLYTLNYERLVFDVFYLRAGGGYISIRTSGDRYTAYSIPIMLNKFYGKRNKKLEIGIGFILSNFEGRSEDDVDTGHEGLALKWFDYGITTTIGYRHQYNNGGIFRIGVQPRYLFGDNLSGLGITYGVSFGAAF